MKTVSTNFPALNGKGIFQFFPTLPVSTIGKHWRYCYPYVLRFDLVIPLLLFSWANLAREIPDIFRYNNLILISRTKLGNFSPCFSGSELFTHMIPELIIFLLLTETLLGDSPNIKQSFSIQNGSILGLLDAY